jgi:hypothetical protein
VAEVREDYFYTTYEPHEWSSEPGVHIYNPDTWKPIKDIDEARECARKAAKGTPGYRGYVVTTYGVSFKEEWDAVQDADGSD